MVDILGEDELTCMLLWKGWDKKEAIGYIFSSAIDES